VRHWRRRHTSQRSWRGPAVSFTSWYFSSRTTRSALTSSKRRSVGQKAFDKSTLRAIAALDGIFAFEA
jgi:hypothetical protein